MTATEDTASEPGMQVGPTSEFSLFFRIKAGPGRRRFGKP